METKNVILDWTVIDSNTQATNGNNSIATILFY